jgi:hypothetical protein
MRSLCGLACALVLAAPACDRGLPSVSPIRDGSGSGGAGAGGGGRIGSGGAGATEDGGVAVGGTGGGFVEAVHPSDGAAHSEVCDPLVYRTSPPSSGTHYPIWAAYKTYAQPVPWGFLVHAMEHDGIVVVYHCPTGCASEVAAAQAWIDSLPADSLCGGRPRIILAPDPTLDCRWAAAAWQWTLRGGAFDAAPFQRFYESHYENPDPALSAPEPGVCSDGVDLSMDGWCP